jgi:hypothetical protein
MFKSKFYFFYILVLNVEGGERSLLKQRDEIQSV